MSIRNIGLTLVLLFTALLLFAANITRADGSDWFASSTPTVTKVVEQPANKRPFVSNFDCDQQTVGTGSICVTDTSIGKIASNNTLVINDKAFALTGTNGFGSVWPIPNMPMYISPQPGAVTGQYVGIYRSLKRSDVAVNLVGYDTNLREQYQITKPIDLWITDSAGQRLQVNTSTTAFSSNGFWMVFDVPRVGLFRMNTTTFDLVPFGASVEQPWYTGAYSLPITISDDGKYAAVVNSSGGLMLYDLSGCTQSGYITGQTPSFAGCRGRDIWAGQFATTSKTSDMGVSSRINNATIFGNLRFVDDGNLRFDARYDFVSGSDYKSARFVVTAVGASLHQLGLLGMGDSYISGEGEFDYLYGTDSLSMNMCHLSKQAYPYLLGADFFGTHESVACSGAQTKDINFSQRLYNGQFNSYDKLEDVARQDVLTQFTPGYIHQNQFAKTYQPEAIVLSIGGNDIHFSDILQSCIIGTQNYHTCYATYQDRLELFRAIDNSFSAFYKTYDAIKSTSPDTRIYVVGYPQIIKPNGDCELNVQLNQSEIKFASELIKHLNRTIQQAAARSGVYYVDMQSAFAGHRLCEASGASAAVNGVTVGRDAPDFLDKNFRFIGKETYHPTVLGHQLLEQAISDQTDGLKKPMPPAQPGLTAPITSLDDPALLEVANGQESYTVPKLEFDNSISADIVKKGVPTKISVSGLKNDTQTDSDFMSALHSDPINLGRVHADSNGDINTYLTIPTDVPTGMHTLHLYGKDSAGQDIDIQKFVYVISQDDRPFGGCGVILNSGVDIDQDGIDDACDGVIGTAPAKSQQAGTGEPKATTNNWSNKTQPLALPTPQISTQNVNPPILAAVLSKQATSVVGETTAVIPHDSSKAKVLGVSTIKSGSRTKASSQQNTLIFLIVSAAALVPVVILTRVAMIRRGKAR